jgi:hypothetical protein
MSAFWRQLERFLIGENLSSVPGSLETSIQPAWPLAPGIVTLVMLTICAVVFIVYWRESPSASRPWKVLLAAIRTCLAGIIVVMLLGWVAQQYSTDMPDLIIVLDDSASMNTVDTYDDTALAAEVKRRLAQSKLDEPTRLNLAKALLMGEKNDLLSELGRRYNIRCYLAGGSARPFTEDSSAVNAEIKTVAANQTVSRLGDCLREVLQLQRGRATAAIILLTDGAVTDGRSLTDAAQFARRHSVPLFMVGLGSDRPPRDLRLTDLLADEAAFVGDMLNFDVKLTVEGYTGTAKLRLSRAGEATALAEQTVSLDSGETQQTVRLSHRAEQPGSFEYVVEVVAREGEANIQNNRLSRKVVVREETIRVLLVQAYPSYEFRFLKQMLLRELNAQQPPEGKAAGFRTVLQEADLAYGDTDKTAERAFPASRDELFEYDVLIFGDVNPALLSPSIMNNIYEFVTVRGGGLIFIAGPRYTPLAYRDTPLAALLPMSIDAVNVPGPEAIVSDSFRPRLSPLGRSSPMMQLADTPAANEKLWREDLAPLRWFATVTEIRPGVRVLAEHPMLKGSRGMPLPIICLQFVGAGKIVFHATDETHRWRFRVGDAYFARYWIQTIRYLSRSKLLSGDRAVELSLDREEYRRGDEVNVRVRFLDDRSAPAKDDGVLVVVEQEGGERRTVTLHRHASERGVFEGSAGPLADGNYRVWLAEPVSGSQPPSRAFTVVAPPGELARLQMDAAELREAAKISSGKFYTIATAGKMISDLPRGRPLRIESLPPQPIWNAPLLVGLFVTLLGFEWLMRKRLGLL